MGLQLAPGLLPTALMLCIISKEICTGTYATMTNVVFFEKKKTEGSDYGIRTDFPNGSGFTRLGTNLRRRIRAVPGIQPDAW